MEMLGDKSKSRDTAKELNEILHSGQKASGAPSAAAPLAIKVGNAPANVSVDSSKVSISRPNSPTQVYDVSQMTEQEFLRQLGDSITPADKEKIIAALKKNNQNPFQAS